MAKLQLEIEALLDAQAAVTRLVTAKLYRWFLVYEN